MFASFQSVIKKIILLLFKYVYFWINVDITTFQHETFLQTLNDKYNRYDLCSVEKVRDYQSEN